MCDVIFFWFFSNAVLLSSCNLPYSRDRWPAFTVRASIYLTSFKKYVNLKI